MRRLVDHELVVYGHRIRYRQPPSVDELLDELAAQDPGHPDVVDERLPYWADLWPSCRALLEAILDDPSAVAGKRVVEIGCGLGLAGIAAGLAGGRVTLTDYSPAAVEVAALNGALNLDPPPDARRMDWRQPDPALACDILLASDVVYESRSIPFLVGAVDTLLGPDGVALVSEPRRAVASPFFDALGKAGFVALRTTRSIPTPSGPVPVDVYRVERAGESS